jgi:hypothetical protein
MCSSIIRQSGEAPTDVSRSGPALFRAVCCIFCRIPWLAETTFQNSIPAHYHYIDKQGSGKRNCQQLTEMGANFSTLPKSTAWMHEIRSGHVENSPEGPANENEVQGEKENAKEV